MSESNGSRMMETTDDRQSIHLVPPPPSIFFFTKIVVRSILSFRHTTTLERCDHALTSCRSLMQSCLFCNDWRGYCEGNIEVEDENALIGTMISALFHILTWLLSWQHGAFSLLAIVFWPSPFTKGIDDYNQIFATLYGVHTHADRNHQDRWDLLS